MNLQEYSNTQRGNQARLARLLGVTPMRLNRWTRGTVKIPIEFCTAIEILTDRKVTAEELRPDLPWKRLDRAPVIAKLLENSLKSQ